MKVSKSSLVVTAAFTGLLSGASARLNAAAPEGAGLTRATGHFAGSSMDAKEKHGCKGQNSCKGKGGCKSSSNGCKGKNSCKGKGGCATDGSKPKSE